jgi:hypothetical protein
VRRAIIFMIMLGLAAAGLAVTGPAASAAGGGPGWQDTYDDDGGWRAQAGSVTITVSGAGGTTVGTRTVPGPTPYCRYIPYDTAEEIQREYGHGDEDWSYEEAGLNPETGLPWDVEERKGTPGRYWAPMCGDAEWLGDPAKLEEYIDDFFAANNIRWVGPADPLPPPPPVPPTVLLAMAEEFLDPPEPEVSVNPVAASIVNIPTWVWADPDTFGEIVVRAESGPNWAQIDAEATGLTLTAPGAEQVGSCASGGTPYVRGRPLSSQSTDCTAVFRRASVGAPDGWPLSVTARWEARGTTSDGADEPLLDRNPTSTVNVVVAEVQAVQAPSR